jgi:hypothetical protein
MYEIEDVELKPGQSVMAVMDETGDTKVFWNQDNQDEVDNARETFDRMKAKGYTAFRLGKKDEQGEVMKTFDPKAERITFAPPMQGG